MGVFLIYLSYFPGLIFRLSPTLMQFPAPPLLKTTIIQLNRDIDPEDNNYEILTNEYSNNTSTSFSSSQSATSVEEQPRKKRRRSSSFVDEEELTRRRNETKQLHSIIEKRRRIKINREFEALKYLIPACRNTDNNTKRGSNNANNNGSKIDGMYKLTILKSAVEYILYLHYIIQKQHNLLSQVTDNYDYDVAYSTVPLDVNQYRDIDKEFDFADLASKSVEISVSSSTKKRFEPINEDDDTNNLNQASIRQQTRKIGPYSHPRAKSDTFATSGVHGQLPTPDVTPDIAPILSLLSKYSGDSQQLISNQLQGSQADLKLVKGQNLSNKPQVPELNAVLELQSNGMLQPTPMQHDLDSLNKAFLFDHSMHKSGSISSSTSPFTIPIKSQIKRAQFYLPDPALSANSSNDSSAADLPVVRPSSLPKKMYFKSRIPTSNMIASVGCVDNEGEIEGELTEGERLEDASKTLLTLRKPSIEKLLN